MRVLLGLILMSTFSFGQTVVFSENFSSVETQYPVIWTGDAIIGLTTGPSIGYEGASGDKLLNFSAGSSSYSRYKTLTVNTNNGCVNKLSFGFKTYAATASNLKYFTVEQSTDGINWTNIVFLRPPDNYWVKAIVNTDLLNSNTLYIRFSGTNLTISGTGYYPNTKWYVDDVVITKHEVLGTEEHTVNKLNVYPNPTTGLVYFTSKEPVEYTLSDLQGRALYVGKDNKLDINELPSAVYLLRLNGKTLRVIKSR